MRGKTKQNKLDDGRVKLDMMKFKQEARVVPPTNVTNESIGLGDVLRIMPDTWTNISWPVQNASEVIVTHLIKNRRMMEEVKDYAMKTNISGADNLEIMNNNIEIGLLGLNKDIITNDERINSRVKEA